MTSEKNLKVLLLAYDFKDRRLENFKILHHVEEMRGPDLRVKIYDAFKVYLESKNLNHPVKCKFMFLDKEGQTYKLHEGEYIPLDDSVITTIYRSQGKEVKEVYHGLNQVKEV